MLVPGSAVCLRPRYPAAAARRRSFAHGQNSLRARSFLRDRSAALNLPRELSAPRSALEETLDGIYFGREPDVLLALASLPGLAEVLVRRTQRSSEFDSDEMTTDTVVGELLRIAKLRIAKTAGQ